ncbi:ImmA/IrrE family metallo-endopeptidase [Patescibacteria group bacterium]|nr:ImmA/IrrE family metallo-endopeptidase [Patescibacteria group bacterium]
MFLKNIDAETRQQIDNLLVLYYKSGGEIPINFELLIKLLARLTDNYIEIIEDFQSKKGGILSPVRWGFRVYVGQSDSLFQKRFTIGHEIGHILHTYDYNEYEIPRQKPYRESPMIFPNKEEENICDEIAGYILCPQELLIKFLEDFHNIPCQLELFRRRERPPFHAKLKLLSEIFEIPISKFCWYIKRQFGEEKLLSLINSTKMTT